MEIFNILVKLSGLIEVFYEKVREKVAIAVAIASITTISSFVISNGKKVYAEEVRVTATANVDNIKDNGKQLKMKALRQIRKKIQMLRIKI